MHTTSSMSWSQRRSALRFPCSGCLCGGTFGRCVWPGPVRSGVRAAGEGCAAFEDWLCSFFSFLVFSFYSLCIYKFPSYRSRYLLPEKCFFPPFSCFRHYPSLCARLCAGRRSHRAFRAIRGARGAGRTVSVALRWLGDQGLRQSPKSSFTWKRPLCPHACPIFPYHRLLF